MKIAELLYQKYILLVCNKRSGYSFYYDSVCDDYLVKTSQNMRYLVDSFGCSA